MPDPILTIGHSTRTLAEFLTLLEAHHIARIVDVRRFPGSRRHPHFSGPALAAALAGAGIGYTHLAGLGGFRKPRPESPNVGLRHPMFRGYADHMDTPEFAAGLAVLLEVAGRERVAAMCAEALPAQCHRRLLADALVARGHAVWHVLDLRRIEPHALAPEIERDGDRLIYSANQTAMALGDDAVVDPSESGDR